MHNFNHCKIIQNSCFCCGLYVLQAGSENWISYLLDQMSACLYIPDGCGFTTGTVIKRCLKIACIHGELFYYITQTLTLIPVGQCPWFSIQHPSLNTVFPSQSTYKSINKSVV